MLSLLLCFTIVLAISGIGYALYFPRWQKCKKTEEDEEKYEKNIAAPARDRFYKALRLSDWYGAPPDLPLPH